MTYECADSEKKRTPALRRPAAGESLIVENPPQEFILSPSNEAIRAFQTSWEWLIPTNLEPILFNLFGDVFLEGRDSSIYWLDTGVGELRKIAKDRSTFIELLESEKGNEWLLKPLLESLLSEGLTLGPDQCFGFKALPVFGGEYAPDNMAPMNAIEWYAYSGEIHQSIKDMPDGSEVRLLVTD